MASLETFESTLKEVVRAKRLSASKVTNLTDIALKCMQNDTQLVSILYRTHKTLSPASKISSLYSFDALARAARNQVNKQGLTGDISSDKGNCATFLLKMEGVLDGLFQDMVSVDHLEAKEKTKKILDIWVKSNTFPSAVLARLSKVVKGSGEKDPDKVVPAISADPRQHSTPPIPTPSVPTPPQTTLPQAPPVSTQQVTTPTTDVQSALFALLSQAANAMATPSNGQITPNTTAALRSASAPKLDPGQLALFQQLTQTAKAAGNAAPQQPVIPLPVSLVPSSASPHAVPPVAPPVGGPSQPLPYRDDQFGDGRREPKYDNRYNGGPDQRGRDRDDYYNDRRDYRVDHNRGGFRGGFRGRGGGGRGRWDDTRDHRHDERNRDREWSPSQRVRRSRSRSPPHGRYGGGPPAGRYMKPYSPPRRPATTFEMAGAHPDFTGGRQSSTPDNGKDEFGRDLRPQSPVESTLVSSQIAQSPPGSASVASVDDNTDKKQSTAALGTTPSPQAPFAPPSAVASSSSSSTSGGPVPDTGSTSIGLDAFDVTTFDPTSPASWEALGKAWTVTHAYIPSQDELMQYVMSGGTMGMYPVASQYGMPQPQQQSLGQSWAGQDQQQNWSQGAVSHSDTMPRRGRGTTSGRGRGGGYGHGNGRDSQWGYSGGRGYEQETDAITLGGGSDYEGEHNTEGTPWQQDASIQNGAYTHGPSGPEPDEGQSEHAGAGGGGGSAGRMQRVGDKWVFVRAEPALATEVASQ